jgi:hypothetical protein
MFQIKNREKIPDRKDGLSPNDVKDESLPKLRADHTFLIQIIQKKHKMCVGSNDRNISLQVSDK